MHCIGKNESTYQNLPKCHMIILHVFFGEKVESHLLEFKMNMDENLITALNLMDSKNRDS